MRKRTEVKDFKNFDEARRSAVKDSGLTNPADVTFSKADPKTGTITEFIGPKGQKLGYNAPHKSPGPGHSKPHVSFTSGGKRSRGTNRRGNYTYEGPTHPSRPESPTDRSHDLDNPDGNWGGMTDP